MIQIEYRYRNAEGEFKTGLSAFYDVEKAKKFIFAIKRKGYRILSIVCDDREDYEQIAWIA